MNIKFTKRSKVVLTMLIVLTMLSSTVFAVDTGGVSVRVDQDNYVNVVLTVGDSVVNPSSFEEDLRDALEDLGMPEDRLNIQAIKSSTTSTEDSDAGEIFRLWANYPDKTGVWDFTDASGDEPASIGSTRNVAWTGYWDDSVEAQSTKDVSISYYSTENFRVKDITPMKNYTESQYKGHPDPQGYTFRMTKDPDTGMYSYYAFWIYSYQQVAALYKVENIPNPNNANSGISDGPLQGWTNTIDGTKVGETGMYTTFMAFADIDYNPLADHHITIDAKGNNIKINYDEAPLFDVTDENDPLLNGSYGPYTYSMPNGKFFNMGITTESSRRFSEVIREPEWLDGSKRFIVNLEDGSVDDFSDSKALGEILARLGNDEIHYIGWGTDANEAEANAFVAKNDNRGTFINNTSSSSIDDIAQYIYNEYSGAIIEDTDYIIYGKPASIIVNPVASQTGTTDAEWPEGKWKINHDESYYENKTGHVPYDGIYLDSLDITLSQVGKYDIYYMDNLVKTVYVHRMPVASYDADTVSNVTSSAIIITNNSKDYDAESTTNSGISSSSYCWKTTTSDTWTEGKPATLPLNDNYLLKMIVEDNIGAKSMPSYKYVSTLLDSDALEKLKPIAEFSLFPPKVYTFESGDDIVTVYNTSYDPAGRDISDNIWTVTKDGTDQSMTPNSSGVLNFTGKDGGIYKISLQTKNDDNILSETVSRYVNIVVDNDGPTAECNKSSGTYNSSTDIKLTFSDEGESGFSHRYVVIDNKSADPTDWGTMGTNTSMSFDLDTPGPNPVYIHYQLEDNAGNINTGKFGPFTLTDNEKPSKPDMDMVSNGLKYRSGDWTDGNVSIDLSGSIDNFTSDDDIVYYYSAKGTDYVSGTALELTAEGTYDVYAKAEDETGNFSDVESAIVKIDRTNPTDPSIALKDDSDTDYISGTWYGGDSVGFTLSGSTDTSGVTYQYKVNDDEDWTEGAAKIFASEGIYNITYRTIDGAGQPSNEQTAEIKVDRTNPSISLKGDNPLFIDLQGLYEDAGVNTSDDLGSLSGSVIVTGTVDTTSKGDYTIGYQIFDQAGNHGEVERTVRVVKPLTVTLDQVTKYVTRVDLKATIENLGASNDLLRYGFVYGRTTGVDIEDTVVELSELEGVGEYNEMISKLNSGTRYYVRAFAEDSKAIRYSEESEFRTNEKKNASGDIEEPEDPEEPEEPTEPKKPDHWAKEKTDEMDENFEIKGVFDDGDDDNDGDDDMNYERGITRGEIAGVMCRILDILDYDLVEENSFDDVDKSHKLYRDMMISVDYGIFKGYGDGTFKPDQVISREEMAAVIHRTMLKVVELAEASIELDYNDKEKIKFWAQEQVRILTELEIFEGYNDGEFKPESTIKVGEAITALYRMADYMDYIK